MIAYAVAAIPKSSTSFPKIANNDLAWRELGKDETELDLCDLVIQKLVSSLTDKNGYGGNDKLQLCNIYQVEEGVNYDSTLWTVARG